MADPNNALALKGPIWHQYSAIVCAIFDGIIKTFFIVDKQTSLFGKDGRMLAERVNHA